MEADEFDRLVRLHLPRLHRLAVRLVGRSTDGEDLAQDALLRMATHWRSCRSAESFWPWAAAIVVNAFRDRLRSRASRPTTDIVGHDPPSRTPSPLSSAIAGETARQVAAIVSALPPREREVLVLCFYEAMEIGEAATALQMTTQNVRTTLAHARRRVADALGLTTALKERTT